MSVFVIPLQAAPSQAVSVTLGTQACRIDLRQMETGLFLTLAIDTVTIASLRLCLDRTYLIGRDMVGDLYFADTQGTSDPYYTGLGSRYQLVYDDAA